jgi:hypothetical protein
MYGLVLDFYWNSPQDPVTVSAVADSLAAVDSIPSIDPLNVAGTWSRDQIVPVHAKVVTNQQTGQTLAGHVCQVDD